MYSGQQQQSNVVNQRVGPRGVVPQQQQQQQQMRQGPPPGSQNGPSRIPEMLEQAKVEYEAILQQLSIYKVERDEFERQMNAQLQEMDAIQNTIKTLESNHRRIRQQYDEDVMRMRRQLEGANAGGNIQSVNNAGGPPPVVGTGTSTTNKRGRPPQPVVDDQEQRMVAAAMVQQRGGLGQRGPPTPIQQQHHHRQHMDSQSGGRAPMDSQSAVRTHMDQSGGAARHDSQSANSIPPFKKSKISNGSDHEQQQQSLSPAASAAQVPTEMAQTAAVSQSQPPKEDADQSEGGEARGKVKWTITYNTKTSAYPETERPQVEMQHTLDHQSVVCCVRFSSDGSMMASGCHKTAQVFDVKTGQQLFAVSRPPAVVAPGGGDGEDAYVRAVCFSPDGKKIVAGMPQQTIRLWDIESQQEGVNMNGHESEIYSLDWVNNLIASGSGDRKVRLWDANNGNSLSIFGNDQNGPTDGVTSVALSPDGRLLAAASLDKVVRIWDTETAQLLDRLEGHSDSVYSIAFSPDGKNVISGSLDRTLMLWDVSKSGTTTTRPRLLFQGHKDFVLSVAYTPDGRWLMSGSKDRTVVFWDPRSTRSVLTLSGYRNSVISVASSPSSPHFATGSGDCFACVWKYQSQAL